ncbi:tryptophan halogenase [Neiella marina]|uniref:Tryptophan halogenase n=1 Tax=Neiella marina TaxID=508461 RepID=A0A8J2XNP7_9GAMM|nr:tryptophan halogenase family protein [Neiella marina]GGA73635.1 tryptophan halogenase [Neiella marina]
MTKAVTRIVIVGGGSAGWLTAAILAAEHHGQAESGMSITLVESPDVKTIGVGEGTWPSMRDTLRLIGIDEHEFLRRCDASFKQGSCFVNWVSGEPADRYYHPFELPSGYLDSDLIPFWQTHCKNQSFADAFSSQSHLCELAKAPKQPATPGYAAVANYGYHLDAGKFAGLLQQHATQRLGVRHVLDHVTAVNSAADGDIESLSTKQHGELEGDLFIDCSGLASILLGQHYQIPFVSQKQYLFNDRAIALQVPYSSPNDDIASATIATAQSAGWTWDIGLPTRRGVGYVYSSAHSSEEQAQRTLRRYIEPSIGKQQAEQATIRTINIDPGHRQQFWHRNCVAIGMAAGFIEPLEASALALVELSAAMIRDQMPPTRSAMDMVAKRFNDRFLYRWGRIIDFLKLHYVLSQRQDSQYWLDCRCQTTVPERLAELLEYWRHQPPSRHDFNQLEEIFPSASYQYVLYGMGFKTQIKPTTQQRTDVNRVGHYYNENAKLVQRYMNGLPSNRELLNLIRQHG